MRFFETYNITELKRAIKSSTKKYTKNKNNSTLKKLHCLKRELSIKEIEQLKKQTK